MTNDQKAQRIAVLVRIAQTVGWLAIATAIAAIFAGREELAPLLIISGITSIGAGYKVRRDYARYGPDSRRFSRRPWRNK